MRIQDIAGTEKSQLFFHTDGSPGPAARTIELKEGVTAWHYCARAQSPQSKALALGHCLAVFQTVKFSHLQQLL